MVSGRNWYRRNVLIVRRHSLPFVKPKYPPPPPPLSLDDPKVTPEATAGFFSLLFFNWISPMMALGSARPLQPTDMWKMDDARSSGRLSDALSSAYTRRVEAVRVYNEKLLDPSTPLPMSRRMLYAMLPQKERREKDYRTKWGKKKASLAMSLNDVFGRSYWLGAIYKVIGDMATATTPLVLKAIIKWATQWQLAKSNLAAYPNIGHAIGMAIGLLIMLIVASLGVHHYFVRKYRRLSLESSNLANFRNHVCRSYASCSHHRRCIQSILKINTKGSRRTAERKDC